MKKYLRSSRDGYVFDWNPHLAARPDMEEVDEKQVLTKRQVKPKERASVGAKENKDTEQV